MTAFAAPNYSGFGLPSSGYGSPIITGSAPPGTPKDTTLDYGVYDASKGRVISIKSGKPWSGVEPRTGKTYANGVESAGSVSDQNPLTATGVTVPYSGGARINPNDPNSRYSPVDIVKDPAVADATKSLLDTFKQSTADSLKGFQDYLDQFRKDTSSALTASKAAQNITPTVNTLTGNQTAYNASLDKSTAAQAAELEKAKADYAALNAANATTQRGIVQKGYNELPAYDAAGNAIADRQMQTVVQNLSRYKLGTGTPTSLGSDESRILAQGAADVMLPLKQSQIARRYDLFGNEANVESGLYGAERNRVASFNPDVAAREFSASQGTAQQEFQSGQVTANTIQNLKERVAQMSYQDAIRFFDLVGVPAQIRQQILGGQISQLGQLAQLNDLSRYRGLSDRLGVNLSQPQYAGFSAPGFPAPSRNPPSSPGNQPAPGLPASNAPKQIGPRGGPDTGPLIPDPSGNGFFDADGNWFPAGSVGTPTYAGNPYSRGSQSNSYYDPASGNYIDRNTGAVTGGNNLQAPSYMGDADLSPLQYA